MDTGASILDIFNSNPSLFGLPVVDEGRLSGLIMKDKFYAKLGTQYGFALYVNRPVKILMDNRPLTVDYETTIDNVSKMAMARPEENLYDYIVVVRDLLFYGIVTVKDLLEKTTELEVNFARHLNPLTGLPGNMLIEQKLKSVLSGNKTYTILYMDIDDFKAYNDKYGFEKGDRVLQYLSQILTTCISAEKAQNSFIGHIGGDDFIMILEGYDINEICKTVINLFDNGRTGFYSKEDIEKGFILNRNRRGEEEHFGIISLSIAGICNRGKEFSDIYELTEYSSRIKKKCKEINGSCYLIG
jgi:diguanylate cyclase (GGDEF)-like protein